MVKLDVTMTLNLVNMDDDILSQFWTKLYLKIFFSIQKVFKFYILTNPKFAGVYFTIGYKKYIERNKRNKETTGNKRNKNKTTAHDEL